MINAGVLIELNAELDCHLRQAKTKLPRMDGAVDRFTNAGEMCG